MAQHQVCTDRRHNTLHFYPLKMTDLIFHLFFFQDQMRKVQLVLGLARAWHFVLFVFRFGLTRLMFCEFQSVFLISSCLLIDYFLL